MLGRPSRSWIVGRWRRSLISLALLALVLGLGATTLASGTANKQAALTQLQQQSPGIKAFHSGTRVTRLYGKALGTGGNPAHSAEAFCQEHAAVFGVEPSQLVPFDPAGTDQPERGLMFNKETGQYKFTLVYRSQEVDGFPVFGSELRLLVRNESDYSSCLSRCGAEDS